MSAVGFWHQHSSASGPNTVYVDGVFDLFHGGHIAFLQKAKQVGGAGARLVVGVVTDEDAQWKRTPFVPHSGRVTMLKHCTLVDSVIENPPLVLDEKFMLDQKIDFVVHGDDERQEQFFAVPIQKGVMRYVSYTEGISTSDIARRVLAAGTAEKKK